MFQAVWNGVVLAESDQTVKVEGNHYFPPEALRRERGCGPCSAADPRTRPIRCPCA